MTETGVNLSPVLCKQNKCGGAKTVNSMYPTHFFRSNFKKTLYNKQPVDSFKLKKTIFYKQNKKHNHINMDITIVRPIIK